MNHPQKLKDGDVQTSEEVQERRDGTGWDYSCVSQMQTLPLIPLLQSFMVSANTGQDNIA